MTLPPGTRDAAVHQVERFCESRSSADYRLEHTVRGDAITLVERRPPWQPGPDAEWSSLEVARLRYDGTSWTLDWNRATGRWERYDGVAPSPGVAPLLAEVDADPDGVFWG